MSREELGEKIDSGKDAEEIGREIVDRMKRVPGIILGSQPEFSFEIKQPLSIRERHTYIIGRSGSGKTNLIQNMILQDLAQGSGIGVLAPDLAHVRGLGCAFFIVSVDRSGSGLTSCQNRTGNKRGLAIKLPRAQSPASLPREAVLMVSISVSRTHGWGNQYSRLPGARGLSPSHRGGLQALFYSAVWLLVWRTHDAASVSFPRLPMTSPPRRPALPFVSGPGGPRQGSVKGTHMRGGAPRTFPSLVITTPAEGGES
jgi:hypothetical protein